MAAEIDYRYTHEIVCPFCGHKFSDSNDYFVGPDEDCEVECSECEKKFIATIHISVTYVSSKLKEDEHGS